MISPPPPRHLGHRLVQVASMVVLLAIGAGCKTVNWTDPITGPGYHPENIYQSFEQLPVSVRRVAMLPTTCDATPSELESGRKVLEAIITEELGKTKKFEIVTVSPENLRFWTGRSSWRAEEVLPADLLKMLKQQLQCDAVMFSRLTQYRAYPPLSVGFSFKLVDLENAQFLWAVDEIYDASEPSVVNGARRYQLTREQLPSALSDSRSILNSPSGFGRYAANSVFQTLPQR